jgi:hypothetical protein
VDVFGGGTVLVGNAVAAGVSVRARDWVADGVIAVNVGVVGTLEGRLQEDMAKTRTSKDGKIRNFITLSFIGVTMVIQMSQRWQ